LAQRITSAKVWYKQQSIQLQVDVVTHDVTFSQLLMDK